MSLNRRASNCLNSCLTDGELTMLERTKPTERDTSARVNVSSANVDCGCVTVVNWRYASETHCLSKFTSNEWIVLDIMYILTMTEWKTEKERDKMYFRIIKLAFGHNFYRNAANRRDFAALALWSAYYRPNRDRLYLVRSCDSISMLELIKSYVYASHPNNISLCFTKVQ